jgi:hypothetical protein
MPHRNRQTSCNAIKLSRYHFEWDPAKQRANLRKHGIEFAEPMAVVRDLR